MAFLRFVVSERDPDSGTESGLFGPAHELRDSARIDPDTRQRLIDILVWFERHLPEPARFNRSRSKGYYRRNAKGIAWFRDSATDCIEKMRELSEVLDANGYSTSVITSNRLGYVVYEDEYQVVAEPFAETRTGPRRKRNAR